MLGSQQSNQGKAEVQIKVPTISGVLFFKAVLEIKPRASHILGKHLPLSHTQASLGGPL